MKPNMLSENPKTFLATCNRLFRYNHKTGELKRRKDGKAVGTFTSPCYLTAYVEGVRTPVQYIVWLMHYKEWPPEAVRMIAPKSLDRGNLRIDNLALISDTEAKTPAATYARGYRKKVQYNMRGVFLDADTVSYYPNVVWNKARARWDVRRIDHTLTPIPNSVIRAFAHLSAAEAFAKEYKEGVEYVTSHPPITPGKDKESVTAGKTSLTLKALHFIIAYDPGKGVIYWRGPGIRLGQRADRETKASGARRVQLGGVKYAAHMLAWFHEKHEWPVMKSLKFKDENRSNIAMNNLTLRQEQSK